MSKWRSAGLIALAGVCGAALAQERPRAEEPSHAIEQSARAGEQAGPAATVNERLCRIDIRGDKKDQWMRLPNAQSSVTQHRLNAGGKSFDYTATAGTLIIRDDADKPIASIGYIAYTRHDLKGARPLMFAFNGDRAPPRCGCTWACSDPGASWCPIRVRRRRARIAPWTTSSACSTRATW